MLGKTGFSTQSSYITVFFPVVELPGIDDVIPFGEKKVQTEFLAFGLLCGAVHELPKLISTGDQEPCFWYIGKSFGYDIYGMNFESFCNTRVMADEPAQFCVQRMGKYFGKGGE